MSRMKSCLSLSLSISVFLSILPLPRTIVAQDLVATENVAGGSSVFVFRESRKKPQARSSAGRASLSEGMGGGGSVAQASRSRANTQIIAAAKKRRAAAAKKQAAVAAANRKITMSNTLTAKADGFMESSQTDLAVTNYRAALVQNPKNAKATDGLSNALTAKGIEVAGDMNKEAAIPFLDEAIKYDKDNDAAYAKLGAVYDANGKKDKALVNYEKAVAINPGLTSLYAPIGLDYLDAGEIAKAEEYVQKSDAAGVDTVETRFLKGVVLFKQNKNEQALAEFDKTLELEGRFADAQYYRGQTLDRLGQQDQAIASYKSTLAIEPGYTPASFDLGVAYYNAGDYDNAAVAYQQTVKNDNGNSQAHANLASTYRQLGRYGDANSEYQAASTGIRNADLYSEWGYSLGQTKEWDKAVARLETARELSPDAIDNSNVGWAYYNEGNTYTAAKNEAAAKKDFELGKASLQRAVDLDPKLDAAYLNLGSTHNALGEFQTAVNVLKIALGLRGNWVIATNQLGLGYRGLNDFTNAVATFKRAVDLDGGNTYGLYNLGETYYVSGNKKEAKKVNDRLRKIDPALASTLDNVIAGKVIDAATQKVKDKVPKVPRLPF